MAAVDGVGREPPGPAGGRLRGAVRRYDTPAMTQPLRELSPKRLVPCAGLTFATVRGAGHMVPYTQPARALHLFEAFLANAPL